MRKARTFGAALKMAKKPIRDGDMSEQYSGRHRSTMAKIDLGLARNHRGNLSVNQRSSNGHTEMSEEDSVAMQNNMRILNDVYERDEISQSSRSHS